MKLISYLDRILNQFGYVLSVYPFQIKFAILVFFCTNDQNSSISTWLRCRSLANTCVSASAWAAARLSHTLIVSYLCPVISSAARKLPRRITINSASAPTAPAVFTPYTALPCVSPNTVFHLL